jgi:large conductance mechanosensitive channel
MLKGFRDFILRGNVVDLAVAVVIGAAFTAVVNSLIAAIAGKPDFSAFALDIHGTKIYYGTFLSDVINFLLIAAAVYFIFVLPINKLMARFFPAKVEPPATKPCAECLSDIPLAAKRCAHCGQPVTA